MHASGPFELSYKTIIFHYFVSDASYREGKLSPFWVIDFVMKYKYIFKLFNFWIKEFK